MGGVACTNLFGERTSSFVSWVPMQYHAHVVLEVMEVLQPSLPHTVSSISNCLARLSLVTMSQHQLWSFGHGFVPSPLMLSRMGWCVGLHVRVLCAVIARCACVSSAWQTDGTTPLYLASQNGHVEVVRALVGAGAAMNQAKVRNVRVADRVRFCVYCASLRV
jgi:hypothetical protein